MNMVITNQNNSITIPELESYTESFIKYLDVDDKTLKSYRVGIRALMQFLNDNGIKNPVRDDIIAFRDYLRENYSSNTVNAYMIAVRALFKYLEIHEKYKNITVDIKGAKYSQVPKKQVLSQEQAKEIYSSLTDIRERCLFSLLISTGLRGIEVQRANIEDIKIYNGEVVLWVHCKQREEKNEYVKLSSQVLEDIKNYIGNRTNGPIFISTSNNSYGEAISTTSIRKMIKDIFKRFGLDSDTFSLHSMRRSCATIMYELGQDIYSIQQVLHHKSINTTNRYINTVTRNNNKGEYIVSNAIFN